MYLSTIDPVLPALPHLFDLPAIATGFTKALRTTVAEKHAAPVPTTSGGTWQVSRLQHLHYQPGHHCIAAYELSLHQIGQPVATTIGVVDYTPQGFQYRSFQDDDALPGLATAIDGTVMAERLATLDHARPTAPTPTPCTVTPLRYRPGQRCALRYTLPGADVPQHFFGKLFHQADHQRLAALPALYALTERMPALPRLPQPLAYWADLHLLLQPIIQGIEFHTYVFTDATPVEERVACFHQLGEALAALHSVTDQPLPHRTIADELAELESYTPIIRQARPAIASLYTTVLEALTTAAQAVTALPPVVCHGALRTDQWLITQAVPPVAPQLMLIDLDTLCLANPASDLSNCLAYLEWKALRQPHLTALIRAAEGALLTGYALTQSLPPAEWLALYRAAALLKIAGRRFRSLTYREWDLTPQLIQAAQTMLSPNL